MDSAALEWLTEQVLEVLDRDGALDPPALRFLLRRYGGGADVADALGVALAHALEADGAADPLPQQAEWLAVFAEASAVSDDPRLDSAAAGRLASLRPQLGGEQQVEPLAQAIEACLKASEILDTGRLLPFAIDELERVIGAAYRPRDGLAHVLDASDGIRGRLGDHVRAASALLTAYQLTARLPYAMLAEELIQFARRTLWDDEAGGFFGQPGVRGTEAKPFALNCEAARGLCRLAALHGTEAYCRAAVVAPGADYGRDAARTLESLASFYRDRGAGAAGYGVALGEWLALRSPSE